MASGVRYRYKGHFISAAKAQKLANLSHVKEKIKTEYVYKGKSDRSYPEYKKPVAKLVSDALKTSRQASEAKRAERSKSYKEAARERAERAAWKAEEARAHSVAVEAAKLAEDEDIGIEEALDSLGFDEDDYDHTSYDDIVRMTDDYFSEGEEFFEFEMADLESEDKYKS